MIVDNLTADELKAFIADVPDELSLRESKELFLSDLGVEYTGDKTWWQKYSDDELASAIGPDILSGTPASPEQVEKFKADEAERLRKLAVLGLRQGYFFAWVDSLPLDELRKETKRVSKTPLTAWELRTWSTETYRQSLKALAGEYMPKLPTTEPAAAPVEEKPALKKRGRSNKPKPTGGTL